MPELPEVETVARDLRGLVVGARIVGVRVNWLRTLRSQDPEAFARAVVGREIVGTSRDATAEEISAAMDSAASAQPGWDAVSAAERADCLDRAAYLLEDRRVQFLSLLVRGRKDHS